MRFSHCIALVGGFCIAVDAVPMSKSNNNLAMHGLKPNATDTAILHEWIMKQKEEQFAENEHWGEFDFDNYKSYGAEQCIEGKAGEFMCKNIDMSGYLRHQDMGSMIRAGNDIWGWTSPDGREFGLVGQHDGTAFIEVMSNGTLVYLGRLFSQTETSTWRDIKVIGHHAYIVSEAVNHGLQIFDLRRLLPIQPNQPVTFDIPASLTAHVSSFGSAHNVVANEKTNMIYVAGADNCYNGLWMIDVSHPSTPIDLGCGYTDYYVHDAQCVIYEGPHREYLGHEICFLYASDHLTIVDVSTKANPITLSKTPYEGARFTHQGWLANKEMTHILLDDETDEMIDREIGGVAADSHTRTYIADIRNLTKPIFQTPFRSSSIATDHNQYVNGSYAYQSNYQAGLRVLDISSVQEENPASKIKEVAFFDCYPEDDEGPSPGFSSGAWSAYPWFKSGYVLLNCIERGVFALKVNL